MPRTPRQRPQFRSRRFGAWSVDQVFLRFEGGRVQANVWLTSSENEVRTERFFAPHRDPVDAVRWIGDAVAASGRVTSAWDVRLRWASDEPYLEKLEDDQSLEDVFIDAFEAALEDVRDSLR
jgi:hypothetical protein